MKKVNNRGFLLAESLVVSTFVLTVLILLFVQFKSLFNSYEDSYNYNTVENIYNLNTMKNFIEKAKTASFTAPAASEYKIIVTNGTCPTSLSTQLEGLTFCDKLASKMGLKTLIYTNSDISSLNTSASIFTASFKDFLKRIENQTGKKRLIGQFSDGTYATVVYG